MNQRAELFRCGLSGKNGDFASVAHPQSGCDALLELKLDALRDDEVDQPFAVLAYFTLYPLLQFGKLGSARLLHIEDMGRSESDQHRLILLGNILLGFAVLLPANADHRSEDAYALLAFVDPAAKLVPCVHPGYSGCRRPLSRDFEDISKRVAMK